MKKREVRKPKKVSSSKKKVIKLKKDEEVKSVGRPSMYNNQLIDELCNRIANSERGVSVICRDDDDMPSYGTVEKWLLDPRKSEFVVKYARAKELQVEFMRHQILDISDDNSGDIRYNKITGEKEVDHDNIQRSKLRVDTRKWLMSKLAPKKYGDKIATEHSGTIAIQPITGIEVK